MTFVPSHRTIPSNAFPLNFNFNNFNKSNNKSANSHLAISTNQNRSSNSNSPLNSPSPATPSVKKRKTLVKLPNENNSKFLRNPSNDIKSPSSLPSSLPPIVQSNNDHLPMDIPLNNEVIDIYLPGKDAWDARRQKAITAQLTKLGIDTSPTLAEQKYSDFDEAFIPTKHNKSMSMSSTSDNPLLDFKMNRFLNNSDGNSVDNSTINNDRPPSRYGIRHGPSLSLSNFNTGTLAPPPFSPSLSATSSNQSPFNQKSNNLLLNVPSSSLDSQSLSRRASDAPSSHVASLADVEEEEEEEDTKIDDINVEEETHKEGSNTGHDETFNDKLSRSRSPSTDGDAYGESIDEKNNPPVIPDLAPQLPPPSFEELSRGFGYEIEYDEEEDKVEADGIDNSHKKTLSGFTIRSDKTEDDDKLNNYNNYIDQNEEYEDKSDTVNTDEHVFNYEQEKQNYEYEEQRLSENTIKSQSSSLMLSKLKPTVPEFVPQKSIPMKESTNVQISQPVSIPHGLESQKRHNENNISFDKFTLKQRERSRDTSIKSETNDGDDWSGFDIDSENEGEGEYYSNPSDEERALQNRLTKRMLRNQSHGQSAMFRFGTSIDETENEVGKVGEKRGLSAKAPAFKPSNNSSFTFRSELEMPKSTNENVYQDIDNISSIKRGRHDSTSDFRSPTEYEINPVTFGPLQLKHNENIPIIKRQPLTSTAYDNNSSDNERDKITLQDVYYKLEQLSINFSAKDILTREDTIAFLNTNMEKSNHNNESLLSALEPYFEQLGDVIQHRAIDRLTLLADLLAGLKPQFAALGDSNTLANKLSEAVKPDLQSLIDLASDKKETASLIVEQLTPHLESRNGQINNIISIVNNNGDRIKELINDHNDIIKSTSERTGQLISEQAQLFTNASSLNDRLGDLPGNITSATELLRNAADKIERHSLVAEELSQLRTYVLENSELRNEISKAQSMHGRLRSEKDRLIERVKAVEEERDFAKTEAELSRSTTRGVEADLVKIEATNGSLIESLNGMSIKVSQSEEQVNSLLDQKQTWYAADRDYQVRVKELELEISMTKRQLQNSEQDKEKYKYENEKLIKRESDLMGQVQDSRSESNKLMNDLEVLSKNSLNANEELMLKNHELVIRNNELEQSLIEKDEISNNEKELLSEATETIEKLMSDVGKLNEVETENLKLKEMLDEYKKKELEEEGGRKTPTNVNIGVNKSIHTPLSPAYSTMSHSTTATYQADDGWYYES